MLTGGPMRFFYYLEKKVVVGAELRGTGRCRWRGMPKGSRKNQGCFYLMGSSYKKLDFVQRMKIPMPFIQLINSILLLHIRGYWIMGWHSKAIFNGRPGRKIAGNFGYVT